MDYWSAMDKRLSEIESALRENLLRDPAVEANVAMEQIAGELRSWQERSEAVLKECQSELDTRLSALRELEATLEQFRATLEQNQPDLRDQAAIAAHNQRINDWNVLAGRHRELAADCSARVNEYNKQVAARNKESAHRQLDAERLHAKVVERFENRRAWHESKGEDRLWRELNMLYAEAHRARRREPGDEVEGKRQTNGSLTGVAHDRSGHNE